MENIDPLAPTTIVLNGKELSEEEFTQEKKRLSEQKVELVSVGENQWRTRLRD